MIRDFKGKTALVTGAGNGFGREIALECGRRGMEVAIADIDRDDLERTAREIRETGAEVLALPLDLSLYENVREMIQAAAAHFGALDLLVNNAGIGFSGPIWEVPLKDSDWMFSINLMAMLWGMREAIPIMIRQKTPAHIVNVSSISGIITVEGMWCYHACKHAVLAATESTVYDLELDGIENIRFSVLCPAYVQTDLHNCERHRPARFGGDDPYYHGERCRKKQEYLNKCITGGKPIDCVVPLVFDGIENDRFYLFTHPEANHMLETRFQNILENRYPQYSVLRGKPAEK